MYISAITLNNNNNNFKSKNANSIKPILRKEINNPTTKKLEDRISTKLEETIETNIYLILDQLQRIDEAFASPKLNRKKVNQIKKDCPFLNNSKFSKGLTFDLG